MCSSDLRALRRGIRTVERRVAGIADLHGDEGAGEVVHGHAQKNRSGLRARSVLDAPSGEPAHTVSARQRNLRCM